jgi:NAD(P)-dependent dehydrogenase (short-subunit alcohol dehydrogenase family)
MPLRSLVRAMPEQLVIVIGETKSLGAAVTELFLTDGLDVVLVDNLAEGERWAMEDGQPRSIVLVAAANGRRCETVERWIKSTLRHRDLVVVGAREVDRTYRPHLHIVPLPLEPRRLLALVRTLLGLALHESSGYGDPAASVNLRARVLGERRSEHLPSIGAPTEPLAPEP